MGIVGSLFSVLLGGVFLAAVITAAVYFLCRLLNSYSVSSAPGLIVLAVLFLLVGAQTTLMVGAFKLKGYASDARDAVAVMVPQELAGTGIDTALLEELKRQAADQLPMGFGSLVEDIDVASLNDYTAQGMTIADSLVEVAHDVLNGYIWRRVLWMLLFVVVAVAGVLYLGRGNSYELPTTVESYDIY